MLRRICHITFKWKTTVQQRRAFVKTLSLSLVYYLLYLQRITEMFCQHAHLLDTNCVSFILGISIDAAKSTRASFLTRMLPLRALHRQQMIHSVSKFRLKAKAQDATDRQKSNWAQSSTSGTVKTFIQDVNISNDPHTIEKWT